MQCNEADGLFTKPSYFIFASKGGDKMEMDMQDPADMWAGTKMLAPLLGARGWGGKTDFG
jgi:hypothetical protein